MIPEIQTARPGVDSCVRSCEEAERACNRAIRYGLDRGGIHADPEHLRLLLDCSRVCARSAEILRRGWWEHSPICLECAELCGACAVDCSGFDDRLLRACAEACRRCIQCCRHYARVDGRASAFAVPAGDEGDAA